MAAKEQTLVVASPFKFGFFAGLGFFVASALMSVLTFVFIAVLGIGSIAATIGAMLANQHPPQSSVHATQPPKSIAAARDSE
jgi:hypothetical protein